MAIWLRNLPNECIRIDMRDYKKLFFRIINLLYFAAPEDSAILDVEDERLSSGTMSAM